MGNDTKTPNTTSNNNLTPSDFSTMSQRNRVTYVAEVVCMARFTSLANVFIAQLDNFPSLKADELYIVRSIIYKPKLEKTQNLLYKKYARLPPLTYLLMSCLILTKRLTLVTKWLCIKKTWRNFLYSMSDKICNVIALLLLLSYYTY